MVGANGGFGVATRLADASQCLQLSYAGVIRYLTRVDDVRCHSRVDVVKWMNHGDVIQGLTHAGVILQLFLKCAKCISQSSHIHQQ